MDVDHQRDSYIHTPFRNRKKNIKHVIVAFNLPDFRETNLVVVGSKIFAQDALQRMSLSGTPNLEQWSEAISAARRRSPSGLGGRPLGGEDGEFRAAGGRFFCGLFQLFKPAKHEHG